MAKKKDKPAAETGKATPKKQGLMNAKPKKSGRKGK